jgi:hypothetical protein
VPGRGTFVVQDIMLITNANRRELYAFLPHGLDVVELGVLRGDNARHIAATCVPGKLVLVDAWSAIRNADLPHLSAAEFAQLRSVSDPYFGGDITDQATHDRIFETCRRNLAGFDGIAIEYVRMPTKEFLAGRSGHGPFDLAYVDADHQYEGVLSDIKGVLPLVREGGLIWLNDASLNARAFEQRMGVLQAAVTAVKLFGLVPLLITNDLNADLVLWLPAEDPHCAGLRFLRGLESANHDFFELPSDLLGSYTQRIPFGFASRLVTSTCTERVHPVDSRALMAQLAVERGARTPQKRRNVPARKIATAQWWDATRNLLRSLVR